MHGLVDVLSLISAEDIVGVRTVYEKGGSSLADDVAGVVSGPLKSVLAAWCTVRNGGECSDVGNRLACQI